MASVTVSVTPIAKAVASAAVACGVPRDDLLSLRRGESPELTEYLDLLPGKSSVGLDAVGECRGKPLLYLLHRDRLSTNAVEHAHEIRTLRRELGSRGEHTYLAVVEPGVVRVLPVSLDSQADDWRPFRLGDLETSTLFNRLSLGRYEGDGEPEKADYVFEAMFGLLDHVARKLADNDPHLNRSDVLSLVGRALFLRFLGDREVVTEKHVQKIAPHAACFEDCFRDARNSAHTCAWLDDTFNGDFLPLTQKGSRAWFQATEKQTNGAIFKHLSAILRSEEPAGHDYQARLGFDWSHFDFAHVPVGLLSQVYEEFCWRWDHEDAKTTSVFYTPRRIASYAVDEAFDGIHAPDRARVLDPACGAGVFLVLAFRRLYQERWKRTGQRPGTKEIRNILEQQLRGFDISESALRLAALSLYLTAIELDPRPTPPHKLRFKNLQGRVLFNCRSDQDEAKGAVLGSLDPRWMKDNRGTFQLVLCNPPWTSLGKKDKKVAGRFHDIGREVLSERGIAELFHEYENPDSVPDLPFVWRAMQWCEHGGCLAFVLPARLLFKQGAIGQRAREAIFKAVTVTGILNCSNLSDTSVWPKMQQPFLLFFASNRRSEVDHEVRFVTPHNDACVNRRGEIRVDSKSIVLVDQEQTFVESWLWKALAIGTSLDVAIVRNILSRGGRPLKKYWTEDLNLSFATGYQIKPKQDQRDASHLRGLPDVNSTTQFRFKVDANRLLPFNRPTACFPRGREIYSAPLVLVKEAPGLNREDGRAWLALQDVAYNESFQGFSAAGRSNDGDGDGLDLVKYLHLLVHSDLWMHYALLTSPKLGAERRKIYKEDLEDFPVIPWDSLSKQQRAEVKRLSTRLSEGDCSVLDDIDQLFAQIYGLDDRDMEVIRDTLSVELPYIATRTRANASPDNRKNEREKFRARLEATLRPFFRRLKMELAVTIETPERLTSEIPYSILLVRDPSKPSVHLDDGVLASVLELSSKTGASMIFVEFPRVVAIGVLNQYRYWTLSRARLCAATILQMHMSPFEQ